MGTEPTTLEAIIADALNRTRRDVWRQDPRKVMERLREAVAKEPRLLEELGLEREMVPFTDAIGQRQEREMWKWFPVRVRSDVS